MNKKETQTARWPNVDEGVEIEEVSVHRDRGVTTETADCHDGR